MVTVGAQRVTENGDPKEFDTAARDRIRRQILHYMTEHAIGVIRLADRITASNPLKPEIPIKTLQRFLAGRHRTNDMYVRFFQKFVEGMPDPDPIGELGRAMAAFYGAEDSSGFVGNYGFSFRGAPKFFGDKTFDSSELTLTSDNKYCRAEERFEIDRLVLSDGVLVLRGAVAIIWLTDRLTKRPTQYLLSGNGPYYEAYGTEAVFHPGSHAELKSISALVSKHRESSGEDEPGAASVAVAEPQPILPSPGQVMAGLIAKGAEIFRRGRGAVEDLTMRIRASNLRRRQAKAQRSAAVLTAPDAHEHQMDLLLTAEYADEAEMRRLIESGVNINVPDPATGLTALHLAVGRNAIGAVRLLVERGARFVPDRFGRMPSTVAVECEASDELVDFIVDAEARAEAV